MKIRLTKTVVKNHIKNNLFFWRKNSNLKLEKNPSNQRDLTDFTIWELLSKVRKNQTMYVDFWYDF